MPLLGAPVPPKATPEVLKFAFGSTLSSKLGCPGPSGQPSGHSEGSSWHSWASSWSSRKSFWCLGARLGSPQVSILRIPARPMAIFLGFGRDFAQNVEIIQKPWFSHGFSMISGLGRTSKSMKNMKKSSPESFGPPKNRQRRAGSAGMAAQVASVGPMGAQWSSNGSPGKLRIANGGL